ncbi:MAG: tRNA (adenosine(37)-N6)-threonylcarbamoyltransferase complex dimerization subunit type 1 TsaB [Planctomycetota bacterium]
MIQQAMGGADSSDKKVFSLAIETSGTMGSVAIGCDATILAGQSFATPKRHASDLMPTIDALCRAHSVFPTAIDQVFVSIGPGSFTGLRIAVTVARMMALAVGSRIVAVPTLETVAQNALCMDPTPDSAVAVLDAKRGRVYAAAFVRRMDRFEPVTQPAEVDLRVFLSGQPEDCVVLGEGVAKHIFAIQSLGRAILPESFHAARAEVVYRLGQLRAEQGQFDDARSLVPLYVRLPESEEKWARQNTVPAP